MRQRSSNFPSFAIVGGGISGLTAAYRLRQLLPDCQIRVFEASDRLGGVLATERRDGFLIERGADSFITKVPWALNLCHELGLSDEVIRTNVDHRRALVLWQNELHRVPEGFVLIRPQRVRPIIGSSLLSWRGKVRLLAERWRPLPPDINSAEFDDNLAHFATERLGQEAFERLVDPLVAGIYTADSKLLSIAATIPESVEVLRRHGTLWHRTPSDGDMPSGARYGSFVSLSGGVGRLVKELADRLPEPCISLHREVVRINREGNGSWVLDLADGESPGPYDGVVVAVPALQAGKIFKGVDSDLSQSLGSIPYASSAVVSMAYSGHQVGKPIEGFGFVIPKVENRKIVAASFSSVKFAGRAPDNAVLVRVFLGGALRPEIVDLSDEQLCRIAQSELNSILAIKGEPLLVDIARWRDKMPQYHVGHLQLVKVIEERLNAFPGLALAGNGYHGVGIPHCVHSGELAAQKMVTWSSNSADGGRSS